MRRALVWLALLGALFGGVALGQTPSGPDIPIDPGKKLAQEASQAYENKEYQKALELFQKVYAMYPAPELLFNMAQCYRQLGQREEAIKNYSLYLENSPNGSARAQAEAFLQELAPPAPASAPASQASSAPTSEPASALVLTPPALLSPPGRVRFGGKDRYRGFGFLLATGYVASISEELPNSITPTLGMKLSTLSHRRFLETSTSLGLYQFLDRLGGRVPGFDTDIGLNLFSEPRNDQAVKSMLNPTVGVAFSWAPIPFPGVYASNLFVLSCHTGVRVALRVISLGGPKTISVEPLYLRKRNLCQGS